MKKIKLSRGKVAKVDDQDFPLLSEYKWYINENAERTKLYAMRSRLKEEEGKFPGTKVYMHRFIMKVKDKSVAVKHKNGDTLDNRRANLVIVKRKITKK
ncbi:MAG: hypothetical protein KDK36_01055 [Leptospiraceae bacterium]|nr:hypothetical protein [Leptospiraceae bacterium]